LSIYDNKLDKEIGYWTGGIVTGKKEWLLDKLILERLVTGEIGYWSDYLLNRAIYYWTEILVTRQDDQ
jgi:hypothetical protein